MKALLIALLTSLTATAACAETPSGGVTASSYSGSCYGPVVNSCSVSNPLDPPCLDTLSVKAIVDSFEWASVTVECGARSWSASGGFGVEGDTVSSITACVSRSQDVWDAPDACATIQI
jgi:hypothetical protein